jgi:predicted nuclease with RNAse H fold
MAEIELAQMGIGCFYTGKKSIIKDLIYRGVKFRQNLTRRGYSVIEVYPYATKVMVFGDKTPSKSRPEGLTYLREHLPTLVPGPETYVNNLSHDQCDALLTAYTAYLHLKGETDSLGDPEEGMIYLPRLRR